MLNGCRLTFIGHRPSASLLWPWNANVLTRAWLEKAWKVYYRELPSLPTSADDGAEILHQQGCVKTSWECNKLPINLRSRVSEDMKAQSPQNLCLLVCLLACLFSSFKWFLGNDCHMYSFYWFGGSDIYLSCHAKAPFVVTFQWLWCLCMLLYMDLIALLITPFLLICTHHLPSLGYYLGGIPAGPKVLESHSS